MLEIGNKIKETRIKKGMSQEDLAELSKLNLRTVQRIENNESIPRGKTLKLVFDALDIVLIESAPTKKVNNYFIWSSALTLLIIVGTLLGWFKFFKMYLDGEAVYRITNGWNGTTNLNDYHLENWVLSMSALSIGFIVIAHSLALIKYQFKYVVIQILILALYLTAVVSSIGIVAYRFQPGLFITILGPILLIATYRKYGRIGKIKTEHVQK